MGGGGGVTHSQSVLLLVPLQGPLTVHVNMFSVVTATVCQDRYAGMSRCLSASSNVAHVRSGLES